MIITDFTYLHLEQAQILARQNYIEEKQIVHKLPENITIPDLTYFAENKLGVVAMEKECLLGYLCCYEPWENAFGSNAKGTFSPLQAHGAVIDNRELIYSMLYQRAAQKWVEQGITYHGVTLYAHDDKAKKALFNYGFGLRCMDAIKAMDIIKVKHKANVNIRQLSQEEIVRIRPLREQLSAHLSESPCFMYSTEQEYQNWILRAEKRNSILYAAFEGEKVIAYIEGKYGGDNFVTEISDMLSICGAFCLPDYRGEEIVQSLLNVMIEESVSEGYKWLGVDYESFNSTAYAFWNKYFEPYTNSVTRRIDEAILKKH